MSNLIFEYECIKCGDNTNSSKMRSFICKCSGDYKLTNGAVGHTFKEYYSQELKETIRTGSQERKAWRKNKVVPIADIKSMQKEAKFIRKNREEIIKDRYDRAGINGYKKGKNLRFHEKTGSFISDSDYGKM